MKANEAVLDGHQEVVLAVLFSHFHTQFAQPSCWSLSLSRIPVGTCQWSCWWCFLHKPNPGTVLVSCSQTTFTKAVWYSRLEQLPALPGVISVTFGTNPRLNYADISFCGKLPTTHFLGISVLYCMRPRGHEAPESECSKRNTPWKACSNQYLVNSVSVGM